MYVNKMHNFQINVLIQFMVSIIKIFIHIHASIKEKKTYQKKLHVQMFFLMMNT
jgi:hypothetical protein